MLKYKLQAFSIISLVKLLFLLLLAAIIGLGVYILSVKLFAAKEKTKKFKGQPLLVSGGVVTLLLGLIAFGMYKSATQRDIQCSSSHTATTKPPILLDTAISYFNQGNYDYEIGNCQKAITDYTKSIELNRNFPQAYNNRAYTYMRLRDYKDAIPDLKTALALKPDYTQALMNLGDIYNYYYQINRQTAISYYKKVIQVSGKHGGNNDVCGHLFLAEHNGWTLSAYFDFFRGLWQSCD